MILAQRSILVVSILIGCWIAFFVAGIVAMLQSLRLSYKIRKYWARKGVRFGLIWWNLEPHLIDDPEYNQAKHNINKVIVVCIVIMCLSGIVFHLIITFGTKG